MASLASGGPVDQGNLDKLAHHNELLGFQRTAVLGLPTAASLDRIGLDYPQSVPPMREAVELSCWRAFGIPAILFDSALASLASGGPVDQGNLDKLAHQFNELLGFQGKANWTAVLGLPTAASLDRIGLDYPQSVPPMREAVELSCWRAFGIPAILFDSRARRKLPRSLQNAQANDASGTCDSVTGRGPRQAIRCCGRCNRQAKGIGHHRRGPGVG